jgi:N-acetylglucosamine kinase-like BadF-type ATPase
MKLIADSGSTKTNWVLAEDGKVKKSITTNGLNPYFHTSESVEALLMADLAPFLVGDHVREVHFYGAGCSTEKNDAMISDALHIFFRKARISIYHDILGAARALFGTGEGIAGILGTGCNSCYFDGNHFHQKVDSLGFLFGDEGAGSYLGKQWIGFYLRKEVPDDLRQEFNQVYCLSLEDILNSLYNRPYPNRFLASFSKFLAPRQKHPFITQMVKQSFSDFFNAQIKQYDNYNQVPVSFIGSIAWFYQEILTETASSEGITIGTIVRDPMEGLIAYHSQYNPTLQ